MGDWNGHERESRLVRAARKLCGLESWRRRVPISIWLPKYTLQCLYRDIIAGITVGLTSIPQGIAYAMVAGLPPQVGLYSSIFPGFVYVLFGSCKDVTVGPTAVLAALLAKYVALSPDFACLAAFLSGCIILLLGVLQLGFLLDFISKPVISGFTTAAALQISASQLKSLFRVTGSSGNTFIQALVNFFKNIKTIHLWDSVLGIASIIFLLLVKRVKLRGRVWGGWGAGAARCAVRARNALLVFLTSALAYILYRSGISPFALTGKIEGGLPQFGPPAFSTRVNNQTLGFADMLQSFGLEGLALPLVAVLESIAIAKAFAGSAAVDGTQEMLALGACNLLASFAQSMPATGSFTRTALNHASGVMTPAGAFFKACVVLAAVTLASGAFAWIPRAALAAVILVAMLSIIDFSVAALWRTSKSEVCVWALTLCTGAAAGLEYGIAAGACADVLRSLAHAARPHILLQPCKVGAAASSRAVLPARLQYMCGARAARQLRGSAAQLLLLDAKHLLHIDIGVAEDIITVILELEQEGRRVVLWNFEAKHQQLFEQINPNVKGKFFNGINIEQYLLEGEAGRTSVNF
ncbi:PREDICTED: sodium-independent sulfate anion transporter-like isoform X2 [Papilio polytes]|uniref:sodium-independent sulfate anion transporter-like isoform X2 n=1 Tax=Papilio polytes TaxID=76194 RepID=UPI0006761AE3|nr:PREDICTED: sodium-independent sulfate anion transporter-like isoform X2 [Papilio polytes]